MNVYLIALTGQDQSVWTNLQQAWPERHYIINDYLAMVAAEDLSGATIIDDRIRKGGVTTSGIVTQLDRSGIAGLLPTPAVEWLRAALNG